MSVINLTGTILKERYCILEQIGSGGNGHLYLARDMELGVCRAVKEIPVSQKREAKLLRLLEHPSFPRMTDYVEKEENCYLVMEYIHGKSLGQLLREDRKFEPEEILEYALAIAQALDYLHTRKPPIYYGDLKPDNLMLSETGKLYLVDLGSAVSGYTTSPGICQGTRGFAAPEQYEGKMSPLSDIYSLGKTVRALAGRRWPMVLWKAPGLWAFTAKCCRNQEERRFRNMEEVCQALSKIKREKGQARKAAAVSLLTAAVLLCVGGVFAGMERTPEFGRALTEITDLYRTEEFLEGKKKRETCMLAEKGLQELLKEYPGKEEQRRLLLLLAASAELQEEWQRAALYYEQLLLYDGGYQEAYGEYGMFLLRLGQEDASRRLWASYEEAEKAGEIDKREESRSFSMWAEEVKKGE